MAVGTYERKDIRLFPEVCVSIPCIVSNTGVAAGTDGKKIVKAGSPVGSATNVLLNRQTELSVSATTAQGVVLHDVDVTSGKGNASVLIAGYVDLLKVDSTTATTLQSAAEKLTKITLMKGAN